MYPVILTGKRLTLRELTDADVDAVHAIVGDPVVCETLIFTPKTRDQTVDYVARAVQDAHAEPRTSYFLAVVADGDLVGTARLGLGEYHSGNIGYATEATVLLIDFGIRELGLHRVWASHGPANPSSARVLLKAGMVHEGNLRHNVLDKGTWRDSLVHSILEHEYTGRSTSTQT